MATIARLLTYEDWLRMPPVADGRDEVVKGELRFMPPTQYPHTEIIQRLISRFIRQTDEGQMSILGSNFGLLISREPLTCRSPDLALYWRNRIVVQDGLYCSAPDLIVEVLSPSEIRRRHGAAANKVEKIGDYASLAVPEVWSVSPEARSVEVRLLSAGKLDVSATLVTGDLRPVRFPNLVIPVAAIWPD